MQTPALRLPATLEKFLAAQVAQGDYPTRQAAIVAAVAGEKRRAERRGWLDAQLQQGLDSKSAGSLDMRSVIRRGRARLAARKRRRAS